MRRHSETGSPIRTEKQYAAAKGSGRIPELDGIRGLAIGMVLVYHFFLLTAASRPGSALSYCLASGRLTWSGVDLFFVLSGFLIGGILIDARGSGNYFKVFYVRRFLRIVPIYLVLLAVARAAIFLANSQADPRFAALRENELPWGPYLVFLQNFWMAKHDTFGPIGLGVTWSLAVEEQFYLTMPALVRMLKGTGLVCFVLAGIIAAPILRTLLYFLYPSHHLLPFLLMPCRADGLLMGVLGAILIRDASWRSRLEKHRSLQRLAVIVFLGGAAALTLKSPSPFQPFMLCVGLTWLGMLYLSLLLYALTQRRGILAWALRRSWLRWLGIIAYGTYLFHSYILILLRDWLQPGRTEVKTIGDLATSVLALGVTLVACRVSWVYFEGRAVRLGHQFKYDSAATGDSHAGPEQLEKRNAWGAASQNE